MERAFVTGGTGFIGGRLVRRLLAEGVGVRVLARDPGRAAALARLGADVVKGDIEREDGLREAMAGCDVVFHLAAWYELGVRDREAMRRANDDAVGTILDAARAAGVPRVVHCSSVGVYGDTGGRPAREGHHDPPSVQALAYTATKRGGHERALAAAAGGQDVVIVVPGSVFGPGDPSIIGRLLTFVVRGWMKVAFYRQTRMAFAHVDDVADGFVRAWRNGRAGREYLLADRTVTLGEIFTAAARAAGRSPPWFWLPNLAIRLSVPLSPLLAPIFGQGPWILRDAVAMMDGVSLDFVADRAREELGWSPAPWDRRIEETVSAFRPAAGG